MNNAIAVLGRNRGRGPCARVRDAEAHQRGLPHDFKVSHDPVFERLPLHAGAAARSVVDDRLHIPQRRHGALHPPQEDLRDRVRERDGEHDRVRLLHERERLQVVLGP
ncbi:hypothetical protein BD309DRAFT_963264 [Dichomitus squalens]|nr:hypothetical protein BD309DRAFT_963264 [Dichomitus squalens]